MLKREKCSEVSKTLRTLRKANIFFGPSDQQRDKGVGNAVKVILTDDIFQDFVQSMAVPDWVLLYFKLSARLPDEAWQMLLNLTRLGNTGVS